MIRLPVKNKDEVVAFFTSDIVRDKKAVSQPGYKEGYLTKRGKNFGGWKTRYFVLQGPVLEYFDSVSVPSSSAFPFYSVNHVYYSVVEDTLDLSKSLVLRLVDSNEILNALVESMRRKSIDTLSLSSRQKRT